MNTAKLEKKTMVVSPQENKKTERCNRSVYVRYHGNSKEDIS